VGVYGIAVDNDATQTNFRTAPATILPTGDQITVAVIVEVDDATPSASMGFVNSTTGNVDGFNMQFRTTPSIRFRTVQSSSGVNSDIATTGVNDGDTIVAIGTYNGALTAAHFRDITSGASGDAGGGAESGALSHDNFDLGRFSAGPGAGFDGGILATFVWSRGWTVAEIDRWVQDEDLFGPFRQLRRNRRVAAAPAAAVISPYYSSHYYRNVVLGLAA
jgi:hypothetical protein